MIFWEWRRIYRQRVRSFFNKPHVSYKEVARRKLVLGFILFFVGWKMFGYAVQDKILYRWDDIIGDKRFFELSEVKEIVKKENEENANKEIVYQKKYN
uniref:DUF4492 domain-containing protein n=1 Tax=Parastrongyloides trichosuri TaxID=131310 RepID=A0A0N4Z6Z1_PARTI